MLPGSDGFNQANSIVLHEAENGIEDDKTILLGWALRQIEADQAKIKELETRAVVVPKVTEARMREIIVNAARRCGEIDYDPEDVSKGDLEIACEIRDDLASLFRAIPADRVLGDGMVAMEQKALERFERIEVCARDFQERQRNLSVSRDSFGFFKADNALEAALRANQGGA